MVAFVLGGEDSRYKVERVFPTEAEMDAGDFFLTGPVQFSLYEDRLYVLDAGEFQVLVFSADGEYLRWFGGRGDDLGSFRFPTAISVEGERVMVADRKSRIQVFDLDGRYQREFETRAHLYAFLNLGDRVFALAESEAREHFFALWSLNGRRLAKIVAAPELGVDPGLFDMQVMLKKRGDRVFALRVHGSGFRIFSTSGETLHRGALQFQPQKDAEYNAVRQLAYHTSFDVMEDFLVTSFMARGHARLNIFGLDGLFHGLRRLELPGLAREGDVVEIGDMRLQRKVAKGGLEGWFLVTRPKTALVKISFARGWERSSGE